MEVTTESAKPDYIIRLTHEEARQLQRGLAHYWANLPVVPSANTLIRALKDSLPQ